jgi:hypothetical protein
MMKYNSLGWSLLLALFLVAFMSAGVNAGETKQQSKTSKHVKSQSKEEPPAVRMGLEPKAIEILKAASSRLAAARTMSFTATVYYESPSRLGTPLVYTTKSEVTLQRPDKLRVITPADGPATEFYYDGKKMTAYSPAENMVAVADAPPTIDEALEAAYDKAAIYFPFAPMMSADPFKSVSEGLILAFYIGQSKVVGGTTTDMIAYANDNVFAQLWIGAEDKLPRMIRAVYRTDNAHLRHQLEWSNWQLDPEVPADAFASAKAANANPIPFANPNAALSAYAKPPAKIKPAKTKGKTK